MQILDDLMHSSLGFCLILMLRGLVKQFWLAVKNLMGYWFKYTKLKFSESLGILHFLLWQKTSYLV